MGLIKDALNKEINKNNRKNSVTTSALIVQYYHTDNTADIIYNNPNGYGKLHMDKVPISNGIGSLESAGIYSGLPCQIEFVKGNMTAPIITGIYANFYDQKTTTNEGSCIVDENINKVEEPKEVTPMYKNWINTNNNNILKYNNDYSRQLINRDAYSQGYNAIRDVDHYTDTESGMTNLRTKATIKAKDNGDLDIFIGNNLGMRLSGQDQNIYFYGYDVLFNGESCLINKDMGEGEVYDDTALWEAIDDIKEALDELNQIDMEIIKRLIKRLIYDIEYLIDELRQSLQFADMLLGGIYEFNESLDKATMFEFKRDEYLTKLANTYPTKKKKKPKESFTSRELLEWYDTFYEYFIAFSEELREAKNILEV